MSIPADVSKETKDEWINKPGIGITLILLFCLSVLMKSAGCFCRCQKFPFNISQSKLIQYSSLLMLRNWRVKCSNWEWSRKKTTQLPILHTARISLVNFWSYLHISILKLLLFAIAAAVAGRDEMHSGIPSCSKDIRVMSDACLIKWVEQVHFGKNQSILGSLETWMKSILGRQLMLFHKYWKM